ncbi:MAG: hypothetical protein GX752_00125 [Clostridium sp.]|nr:hypothetical protein [Clostridium sp.]
MHNKVNRVLVESAIKKGISDIKDNPQRGIRNLLDLGTYFIKDKFEKNILNVSRKIFNNPKSPYYDMLKNVVLNVDENILKTFSFNLGYNSLTNGAKIINKNKELYKCYIPWIINFNLKDQNDDSLSIDDIIKIVDEGKTLGIYSYVFFIDKNIDFLFPLLEKEKDSAFFLMTEKDSINKKDLEKINSFKNTYISISMEYKDLRSVPLKNTLNLLKGSKSLHGVHSYYNHESAPIITTNRWLRKLKKLNLSSAFLIESNPKDLASNIKIKNFTDKLRRKGNFKAFLVNYLKDITSIQNSISKDKSYLQIDSLGNLQIDSSDIGNKNINLKKISLIESLILSMKNI